MKWSANLFVFCVSLLTGCATVLITDNIPNAQEKGYVELYCSNKRPPLILECTQLINGKEVAVGNTGIMNASQHRRIACLPGTHTFFIRTQDCVERVDVVVSNGMVTPIVFTFKKHSEKRFYNYSLIILDCDIRVEQPMSTTDYENRITHPTVERKDEGYVSSLLTFPATFHQIDTVSLHDRKSDYGYVNFFTDNIFVTADGSILNLGVYISYCDPKGAIVPLRSQNLRRCDAFIPRPRNFFSCPVGTNMFILSLPNKTGGIQTNMNINIPVYAGFVTPVDLNYETTQDDGRNIFYSIDPIPESPREAIKDGEEW